MTRLTASLTDVDAIWRAHATASALALARPELRQEFCDYPKNILEKAIAELSADELRTADGVERWLVITKRVGEDWLRGRREYEAERARRRETSPTPCPRCRRTLGPEVCECGFRPGWVTAPPRTIKPGDFPRAEAPFTPDWEAVPELRTSPQRAAERRARKTTLPRSGPRTRASRRR